MTLRATARLTLGAFAALSLTLAGCSTGGQDTAAPAAAQSVGGVATAHNDADVAFVRDMIPHHEGAVVMSELAVDRAGSPQVKDLAQRIARAQGPEIERMQEMAKAWNVEVGAAGSGGGHGSGHGSGDGHGSGGGHGSGDDAAALEPLSGAAFDREFLSRMIAHHESALPMATAELEDGENAQAKELAREILAVQRAEIAEMKALLAGR
jgi:uncharacterized protein (DUF305 family)